MVANWFFFGKFILSDEETDETKLMDQYINDIGKRGEYADNLEIIAVCGMYSVMIRVYQVNSDGFVSETDLSWEGGSAGLRILHLSL